MTKCSTVTMSEFKVFNCQLVNLYAWNKLEVEDTVNQNLREVAIKTFVDKAKHYLNVKCKPVEFTFVTQK